MAWRLALSCLASAAFSFERFFSALAFTSSPAQSGEHTF